MNIWKIPCAVVLLFLVWLPCVHAGKNLYKVQFGAPAGAFDAMLSTDPDGWDFGFRPYSASAADLLVTDPAVEREVAAGQVIAGARPTAMRIFCDDEGFYLLVFSGEPDLGKALAEGEALPRSSIEMFFMPGDTDEVKMQAYYQVIFPQSTLDTTARTFPWQANDRNFKDIQGCYKLETRILPSGYLTRFFVPWDCLWNRLPFSGRTNNLWRFSIIRWCPGGGQTWGGVVHEQSRAGYVQWPDFTREQRASIYKNVLRKAWNQFLKTIDDNNLSRVTFQDEPYRRELPAVKRSCNSFAEDRAFREQYFEPMIAERKQFGKRIGEFDRMTPDEQRGFYETAVPKLINFQYDLEQAYADHLKRQFLAE